MYTYYYVHAHVPVPPSELGKRSDSGETLLLLSVSILASWSTSDTFAVVT